MVAIGRGFLRVGVVLLLGLAAGAEEDARNEKLAERDRLREEFQEIRAKGDPRQTLAAVQRILVVERDLFGDTHGDVADTLGYMAELHEALQDRPAARHCLVECLEIRSRLHGPDHWRVADARVELEELDQRVKLTPEQAALYREAEDLHGSVMSLIANGSYREAVAPAVRVVRIWRELLGEHGRLFAAGATNLARLHKLLGELPEAEGLYIQALEARKRALGEEHPWTAESMSNLAILYNDMGEYARAEDLHRRALDIRARTLGKEDRAYGMSLSALAAVYHSMGDSAKAESLLREALEVVGNALGETDPAYATSLNNLAALHQDMGEFQKARPLFRQALEVFRASLGSEHPRTAVITGNLAHACEAMGDFEVAESLHRRALEIQSRVLGEEHPDTTVSLHGLARCAAAKGRFAEAEQLLRRGLAIGQRHLDLSAAAQSEQQQLAATGRFRGMLDTYLSVSPSAGVTVEASYVPVLAWKGAVQARKVADRALAGPDLAGLAGEYGEVSRRLATLAFSVPPTPDRAGWHRQVRELTERREKLEAELSGRSAAYRAGRDASGLTPEKLSRVLPSGVVLVDFLEYEHLILKESNEKTRWTGERRLVAFVVRPGAAVVRADLGPAALIADAIELWRRERGDSAPLGRLILDPIRKLLKGSKTILVSPDGALCRFPFGALPGDKPDTWLIEDEPVAVLPAPQLLPLLLKADPASAPGEEPSLLLLGDVDYESSPGEAVAPTVRKVAGGGEGTLPPFGKLPGTRAEIVAIRDSFETRFPEGAATVLRRGGATEQAFRTEAPRHRWLHLATHGFFAPPRLRATLSGGDDPTLWGGSQAVPGCHPGLLSGLALSGANTPAMPGGDDGILTALEVESLDLTRVETVVLSACESGLGEVASGEGVLGLQRAFQVAGARSTVTSLWDVPDAATQRLMQRFYENLWDRGLGKLKALTEAQLWVMRSGGGRGLGLEGAEKSDRLLPPYYWAGFVLSGDWR